MPGPSSDAAAALEAILAKDPADWTLEEQVLVIRRTDNGLGPDDPPEDEQPPQDPNWRP